MKTRSIVSATVLLLLALAGRSPAQPTTQPEQIDLKLQPAALPEPALKYRLVPPAGERTPGNAVMLYMIAFDRAAERSDGWKDPRLSEFNELVDASVDALDVEKARSFTNSAILDQLLLAGRRSECTWDPAFREQGFAALLPYLNSARVAAEFLSIQIKLEMKTGHFDNAVELLQAGFSLADNLEREPIMVQCLVAAGIRAIMFKDVRELIQRPGAPNLYWALANMNRSPNLWRRIVESEREGMFYTFPALKHPQTMTASEATHVLLEFGKYIAGSGLAQRETDSGPKLFLRLIGAYPKAKEWMIAQGTPADQVNAMPANAVVLTWWLDQFRHQSDDIEKWTGLPPWQALPGLRRTQDQIVADRDHLTPLQAMLPNYTHGFANIARGERERAVLQLAEAIRAYADAHGGAAPPTLDALSPATPAPTDPMTGRPFDYAVPGNVIEIRAASPLPDEPRYATAYQITIAH